MPRREATGLAGAERWGWYRWWVTYVFRFLINLFRSLLLPVWLLRRRAWSRGEPRWIRANLSPRIVAFRSERSPLQRLTANAREQGISSLDQLRALVDEAARDPKIRGVLVTIPPLESGWVTCESVRELIAQLRAANKQVVCYLPQGGGNRELYVALGADRVYVAPYASFGPLGLAVHPMYFRPLLDRLGIRVEAIATGEYKSAAEAGLRENMSDAAREQLDALLAARQAAMTTALQQRGLTSDEVSELFTRALLLANEALASNVVDGVVYEDELPETLRALTGAPAPKGDESAPEPLQAARYMRLKRRLWLPLTAAQQIAIVPLHGMITGEVPGGIGSGLKQSTLAPLLRALAKDPEVRAVVLHIDSPGGSALASEQMHHDIKQLARKKPVVACFGEVAASGGYYLACACNKIVAHDLCTTGSIGVVMAKVDAHDFVARIGLRPQFVRTAASADMLSPVRSLSEREQTLLGGHVAQLYQRFLAVVAEGRGRSVEQVDSVARGRVWTGSAAKDHGLVDAIGSMDRALSEARALLPELAIAERDALKPRVFRVKSGRSFGLPGLVLGSWFAPLRELAALASLSREAALYYTPLTPED
jgi:protease-4